MDEFGNPIEFGRQKITFQQREEMSQKQFWNDFHRKRGLKKTRPLEERQAEEEKILKAGQERIDAFHEAITNGTELPPPTHPKSNINHKDC